MRPHEKSKVKHSGPYGLELQIDLHDCPDKTFDAAYLKKTCYDICKEIGMRAGDFAQWGTNADEDEESNPSSDGISNVLFIETSSITIHAIDRESACYVNIFSCRTDWDTYKAMETARKLLGGTIVAHHTTTRL